MNIVCVICSDLLIPSDDVFHTPCGHIFHFVCVTQWLERSKTCPQCREKTTLNKIHRIYFNFSNNDTISEDTYSLQDKVDKLNFQLMLKEKDIKHRTEKIEMLEKQNKELKKEVGKVESELSAKSSAIFALTEQIKYLKKQNLEIENKKKEIEQLQKRIENYKNIQTLVEAATEDIIEMMNKSRTCDPNTLITYISVMKREMTISLNKRRELRSKLKNLQQELTKVSIERNFLSEEHTRRKKLEEDLMLCEREKMFLQNKLTEIEKNIPLMQKSINFNLKTTNMSDSNSNNSSEQDEIENIANNTNSKTEDVHNKGKYQSTNAKGKTNSPYLPVKSGGAFVVKHHTSQKSTSTESSVLTKKRRIEQERAKTNTIPYDGLGGHAKFEPFPIPSGIKTKKEKVDSNKPKKQKFDWDNN